MDPPEKGQQDHLSDYERAVCYYTLPKTTSPVTNGLVLVYGLICLEAVGALSYGLLAEKTVWTRAGALSLAAAVVFGIVVFMSRAFLNEFNRRKALAAARGAPDAAADPSLPDPFADHLLLRRPLRVEGLEDFVCADNKGNPVYTVRVQSHGSDWVVHDADGEEVLRSHAGRAHRSFMFGADAPSRITVHAGDMLCATIHRRFSLNAGASFDVYCQEPEPKTYGVRQLSVYQGRERVGRIYELRHFLYLDLRADHFHPGLLALYIAMG